MNKLKEALKLFGIVTVTLLIVVAFSLLCAFVDEQIGFWYAVGLMGVGTFGLCYGLVSVFD